MRVNDQQSNRPLTGMHASDTQIAIVLVNWNAWQDCIDCLDSLLASTALPFHVYVVVNASADDSLDKIAQWCALPVRPQGARDHSVPLVISHSWFTSFSGAYY